MLCIVGVYFTTKLNFQYCQMNFSSLYVKKYAHISVSIYSLHLPQTLSKTISLQIFILIIVVFETKKKLRKREKEKKEEGIHIVTL